MTVHRGLLATIATLAVVAAVPLAAQPGPQAPADLATTTVGTAAGGAAYLADGQVEAVRETSISPQVSGQVITLTVRAGDKVKAGQLLVRIDPRAAQQNQAAAVAQLAAAKAQLVAADRSLERTRQLVAQKFLSPATLDRAEADQRAAAESVKALNAQMAGAATQTGWYTLNAPFDAIVTSVSTQIGDTAMPGKPLLQLHDPSALRVAVNVPAAVVSRLDLQGRPVIDIPDAPAEARSPTAGTVVIVAAADPVSHTQLVRIDLPPATGAIQPGLFARVRLPMAGEAPPAGARLMVPSSAVVARGDLRGVFVVDTHGVALRQVRIGRAHADEVEVLAGVSSGEKIATDPVAAARVAGVVKK